jgi:hypothetical protein
MQGNHSHTGTYTQANRVALRGPVVYVMKHEKETSLSWRLSAPMTEKQPEKDIQSGK